MITFKSLLKEYWKPTDPEILDVAEWNSPADDNYQPSKGEHLPRVVWGIKSGQDIKTHTLKDLGLRGDNPNIYGIHVSGDTDYWIDQLELDYDRDRKDARVIEIISAEGDMLIDDSHYSIPPEVGEKASGFILLTKRSVLNYGKDWVFR